MVKAYHRQKPETQRTLYSQDRSMSFYLDVKNRLLIKAATIDYPFPLDNASTLALANLLKIFYADIAAAAMPYTGPKERGRTEDW